MSENNDTAVAGLFVDGGDYSNFSLAEGNYHVKVQDASNGVSKSGRGQTQIKLCVSEDPNHASKEGKTLTTMFVSFAAPDDDAEKAKTMRGFRKRLIYDGFGLPWSAKPSAKPFDPRVLIGRTAWVQVKNDKDGKPKVQAVSQDVEKLPLLKPSAAAIASTSAPKNGATGGARARR